MPKLLDPKLVDRAPIDGFTPMIIMLGMVARAVGVDQFQTGVINVALEVTNNAFRPTEAFVGKSAAKTESPRNMLTDIAASQLGWLLMNQIIRSRS